MSIYRGIRGFTVQTLSSNPSPLAEGQLFYNSTTGKFVASVASALGTWSTGGTLNVARKNLTSAGTQTSAIAFGGDPHTNISEQYNGTAWNTAPTMPTPIQSTGGAGTSSTSAIAFGGDPITTATVFFNGSWSVVNSMNTAITGPGGGGTATSALSFGGDLLSSYSSNTESYNGSWTNQPSMNSARKNLGAATANNTTGLAFGAGQPADFNDSTESYNGSWTTVADLNVARGFLAGTGTVTAALAFGGAPQVSVGPSTESWNGSAWTNVSNMLLGVTNLAGTGSSVAALGCGGYNPTPAATNVTQEYNTPAIIASDLTTT